MEGLAKEKEAAVEAALADLIDVHKATLEKSKEEYGRRVEEEAAKTRAAEVLRKAAVDEAKEEYEARMVAERALEMAAMEEDVDVVPKEEVDAAVVATAKAHAEELAVLMAKLKAFEERAEAAEAKAEAEAATRRDGRGGDDGQGQVERESESGSFGALGDRACATRGAEDADATS